MDELQLEILRDLETNVRQLTQTLTTTQVYPFLTHSQSQQPLTHKLVRQISRSLLRTEQLDREEKAQEILSIAKIRFRMQQVERPCPRKSRWKQILSHKRRRAVIDCFLAVPFFQLKE